MMANELTIEVVATTAPPKPGFMVGGCRVQLGEKVRVPLWDAESLLRAGKCRIIEGTAKEKVK